MLWAGVVEVIVAAAMVASPVHALLACECVSHELVVGIVSLRSGWVCSPDVLTYPDWRGRPREGVLGVAWRTRESDRGRVGDNASDASNAAKGAQRVIEKER